MRKNLAVFLGLLLAVAVILGWLWKELAGSTEPQLVVPPLAESSEPYPDRAEFAGTGEMKEPRPGAPSAPDRLPVVSERVDEAAALGEGGWELSLVDAAGWTVAGAEAWVFEGATIMNRAVFRDLDRVDSWMEEHATLRLADPAGKLRIADPGDGTTLVLARRGDLWGKRSVDAKSEAPLVLELKHDVTLRAQVLDETGQPLPGVVVGLRKKRSYGSHTARGAVTEDQTATVRFLHAQHTVDAEAGFSWALGVDGLFEEEVKVPLEPDALPEELVILTLPAVGLVEVKVLAEDWKPFTGKAMVELGIVREGEPQRLSPFSGIRRSSKSSRLMDGHARFPMVEVGRELEVSVRRGNSMVGTHAYGSGPACSGDTARLEVRLGSDHPIVRLRAVDERGAPMAEAELGVVIESSTTFSSHSSAVQVETDSEGSFEVDLAGDWTEGSRRTLRIARGSATEPELSAEVDVSRKLRPGINDLGDVILAGAAVFVMGRVVSEAGQPVADAELVLSSRGAQESRWESAWNFRHRTDGEGRFEIRERSAGDEFRLGASKSGWVGPPREFTPGERDLVIEMGVEGAITGAVLLDPEIPRELIEVEVKSYTGGVDHLRYSDRRTTLEEDGAFRLGGLLPGEHTVMVRAQNVSEGLRSFSGVVVSSGETSRDPRLAAIDLRRSLWLHRVTLHLPEGSPRPSGRLSFGPAGAEVLAGTAWVHDSKIDVLAEEETIDLVITLQGLQSERREGVHGAIEIDLRRGQAVRLVLAPDVELPEPPFFIKAALVPLGGDGGTVDFGVPAFDETREIVVRAPGTGKMKIAWIAERRGASSSTASAVHLDREQIVELLEGVAEQRVEVQLSEEELKQVLERLR